MNNQDKINMSDGRGGARKGAGRPKKADEDRVRSFAIKAITETFGSEEAAWKHLASKAMEDNKEAYSYFKMLLEYTYGKPTDNKNVDLTMSDFNIKDLLKFDNAD